MSMTVKRTSAFPASRHDVFLRLQKLETLQKVAWPYATFTPVDGNKDSVWEAADMEFREVIRDGQISVRKAYGI